METFLLHKNTFGNSPSAIKLVEIINEKQYKHHGKIGKSLTKFNLTLNQLDTVKDIKIKFSLAALAFNYFRNIIKKYEMPYNTFTDNVLNSNYKKWLAKHNGTDFYTRNHQF